MELTAIWQIFSIFGSVTFWLGATLGAIIIYVLLPKETKKYASWYVFGALPAVVISWLIVEGLKFLFQIPRPCIGFECPAGYSFPSGHAAVIFAAMTVATIHSKSRKLDATFIGLALLVALSRFFLGFHRIEDVIVGGAIGFLVGYLIYKNYKNILKKVKVLLR
jgi:undecaprenyl-diphosphatase